MGGVLAVDIGLLYDAKSRAQAAADFAALAAAQDLPQSLRDPDFDEKLAIAEETAERYLLANGFDADRNDIETSIVSTYEGEPDKIEVSVSLDQRWLFARLFGEDSATVVARAVGQTNAIPRDIVIVLDRSGSMCRDSHQLMLDCPDPPWAGSWNESEWQPFDTMREAATDFAGLFRPTLEGVEFDRLALVSYSHDGDDDEDDAVLDAGLTNDFIGANSNYAEAIEDMRPAGYTNIGHGLAVARAELEAHSRAGADKVIILLTDGIPNRYLRNFSEFRTCSGSGASNGCNEAEEYAEDEAEEVAALGYRIFTIGYTDGASDDLMEDIAQIGRGQFFDVDEPEMLSVAFGQIADLLAVTLVE